MKKIWIVIHVHHGLIQEPEIFTNEQSALRKKKKILETFNADYDEIEIFTKQL